MRRGYTVTDFRRLVDKLRNAIPDIAISTDIITGFCGETEKDFLETYDLMQEIQFDFAFMFKYSEREGTFAFKKMNDDVPEEIKSQRLQDIIKLQEMISLNINKNYVGNTYPVLIEGKSRRKGKDGNDRCYGKTPQNKTAVVADVVAPNTIVDVKIEECTSHTLYGRLN
jgi:tRNA-2-methylthio-N6-dimethylallyladenosine synthase